MVYEVAIGESTFPLSSVGDFDLARSVELDASLSVVEVTMDVLLSKARTEKAVVKSNTRRGRFFSRLLRLLLVTLL